MSHNLEPQQFLTWIKNRLLYKYQETEPVLDQIDQFLSDYSFIKTNISDEMIDRLCKKYYADFEMDNCDINIGYSETQRDKLREFMRSVLEDYKNL